MANGIPISLNRMTPLRMPRAGNGQPNNTGLMDHNNGNGAGLPI
jgi:hypothetical protein